MTLDAHPSQAQPEIIPPTSQASKPTWMIVLALSTLAIVAFLLYFRLGHYALWDDEANTALIGKGVWATGDTSAVIGHNIVAYRGGVDLENLRTRYIPPLQFYVAAPFTGPWAPNPFIARLPFTTIGLAAIALLLYWLSRETSDPVLWVVFCIALILNVSLLLYLRQCRWYALALFFSIAVLYFYRFWDGKPRTIALFCISAILLLATNYLSFGALMACLMLDYLIWGRKEHWLSIKEWLWILVPVAIVGGAIFFTWYPLGKSMVGIGKGMVGDLEPQRSNTLLDRVKLVIWYFRDLNLTECLSPILLAVAIGFHLWRPKGSLVPRGLVALVIYVTLVSAASPQVIIYTHYADVRYVMPSLVLTMVLAIYAVWRLSFGKMWVALPLALLCFGTNLTQGGSGVDMPLIGQRQPTPIHVGRFSLTFASFLVELWNPPPDPYTETSKWINKNVKPGESVWVVSDYQLYPLMYHSPHAIYAWQLDWPPQPQYSAFPEIHFRQKVMPDYMIAFGPRIQALVDLPGNEWELAGEINCFWLDRYRPELFWRTFREIPITNPKGDGVVIVRRIKRSFLPLDFRL